LKLKSIAELDVSFNADGWGPKSGENIGVFGNLPYRHFDKKEKICKPADFNQNIPRKVNYRFRGDDFGNSAFIYQADDDDYVLVDPNIKPIKKYVPRGAPGRGAKPQTGLAVVYNAGKNSRTKNTAQGGKFKPGMRNNRRIQKVDRAPSLAISSEWEMVEEFDLSQLLTKKANAPQAEELTMCGHLDAYNEAFERLSARLPKPLKKFENKCVYSVTTKEDPVMIGFSGENIGDIYATDSILAQLVASPRSVSSWDIVIEKTEGQIFLDTRDNSDFDLLTVSETSHEPPADSDETLEFNRPGRLSVEATAINQSFSQQVLGNNVEARRKFQPHPFHPEESKIEPASVAYRYRLFRFGDLKLVVRCEVHAYSTKSSVYTTTASTASAAASTDQYLTCYALNEWDSRYAGGIDWRQKFDQQRGAVLGTEIKNNSCKLAKWTVQSILAEADLMKVGFVTRSNTKNPHDHVIIGAQSFKPKDFASQINLQLVNIWGIIKMFCELLISKSDGKYVLIKDPNKSTVRLYSVPLETFEVDESDLIDEEAAEDGEGSDGEAR